MTNRKLVQSNFMRMTYATKYFDQFQGNNGKSKSQNTTENAEIITLVKLTNVRSKKIWRSLILLLHVT